VVGAASAVATAFVLSDAHSASQVTQRELCRQRGGYSAENPFVRRYSKQTIDSADRYVSALRRAGATEDEVSGLLKEKGYPHLLRCDSLYGTSGRGAVTAFLSGVIVPPFLALGVGVGLTWIWLDGRKRKPG